MARFRLREGWITFILLGAAILTVTGAIQRADWTDDLAILTPITFGGLGLGLALAKWRRFPALLAHLLALVAGLVVIINQMQAVPDLLPLAADANNWQGAVRFLGERAQAWYAATGTGGYEDDFYLFVLGLAGLIWLLAYACTWMLFRSRWIWPALLLPATVLLVNLGYATAAISNYLVLFVICALLLVVRFHVVEREEDWRRNGIAFPQSLGWRALWIGVVVVILTVGFGWGAPFTVSGPALAAAWGRVNGPWERLETSFGSRFGSIRGNGPRGIGNFASFGDRFRLGGPLKLSQTPVLVMQADQPYYLKARTYDNFDGQSWSSTVDDTFVHTNDGQQYAPQVSLSPNQPIPIPEWQGTEQKPLNIRMLENKGNILFTADQFVSNSQDSYVVMSWTQYRNQVIDLNATKAEDLPPDLRNLYSLLMAAPGTLRNTDDQGNVLRVLAPTPTTVPGAGNGPRRTATPAGPPTPTPSPVYVLPPISGDEAVILRERSALTARLIDVRPVVQDGKAMRMIISGQLPNYGDVESIQPRNASVGRGTTYQTTISTSTALAPALREAGRNYPAWVTQRYLQLPASTTERTRQLAKDLENGQEPYDAALAIQGWLRDNITYNENIDYPPADQNLVDYVLFQNRQGYCEYYSSAMVMMLRSLGIPARESVGFFSGEYDEGQAGFLYRESNAHAWPEAYFPGYGWVRFEPTSARSTPDREPAPDPSTESPDGTVIGGGSSAGGLGGEFPEDQFSDGLFDGSTVGGTAAAPPSRFWQAVRIVVPVAAVIAALLAALWLLGLRGLSPSGQFYARMTRSGRLAGVRPEPGATPYEWAREVGTRVPDARRSLDQITALYVRERYAGKPPTMQELRLIQRAWLSVRGALVKSILSLRRPRPSEGGD